MQLIDIQNANKRVRSVIHYLPAERSETFSKLSGAEIYLKQENRQKTGSFKVRGAYNKIAKLYRDGDLEHVVASSAGNHAQGVAYAASKLGIKATIVMPRSTPIAKVQATRGYGANVVLHGDGYDDAYAKAVEIQEEEGAVFIHPFDDEDVIAGQATLGLEILKDVPTADVVLVPAGGGGLLSGIAYCIKNINPRIRIIGVQASGADAIVQSFHNKRHMCSDGCHTICDGIAVKIPGSTTVKLINEYVDDMITVTDADVSSAILMLMERLKSVVEPAGAASLAAALSGKLDLRGLNVVCLLSGGNIDVSFIHKIVEKGLIDRGRRIRFRTTMLDTPGSLERFAKICNAVNANIILFQHDRLSPSLGLEEAIIHVAAEVSGREHSNTLIRELEKGGFSITMEVD